MTMQLVREDWTTEDMDAFMTYLRSLGKGEEKARWEGRILKTSRPCLAVPATEVKRIVRQIAKGNLRAFIAHWRWDNYTASAVLGQLICYLPFEEQKPLLLRYAAQTDTWAGTDCLTFTKAPAADYLAFAKPCFASAYPFVRRLGLIVMLKIVDEDTVDAILAALPALQTEQEYYVNMAVAWLVAECFTKQRDKTLVFLEEGKYNEFVARKAVSKCRDSYRVSPEDKEMLLKYRPKR